MQHRRSHRGLEAQVMASVHEVPGARDLHVVGEREQLRDRRGVPRWNQCVALTPHERGGDREPLETRPRAIGPEGRIERHLTRRGYEVRTRGWAREVVPD